MPFENTQLNGGGSYVPPDFDPPDTPGGGSWSDIANIVGAVTAYKVTNFAAKAADITSFNGTYPVISVAAKEIVLGDPDTVNPAWTVLGVDDTIYFSPRLFTTGFHWIGPFTVDMDDCEEVTCNFVCPQGLFRINQDGEPRAQSVSGLVEVTPINDDGTSRGAVVTFPATLTNSPEGDKFTTDDSTIDKSPRGLTLRATLDEATVGRVKVRFRRTTPLPEYKDDQFTDELIIRDCYGIGPITREDFGNITSVQTRVQATSGMTAQKERKLQCVVTRKVLQRNEDNTFGPALVASQSADDIICHMTLDPYLGGRSITEIDVQQIYDAVAEAASYFGFPESVYFNYSFDDDNISYEEMVQMAANAIFSSAYRQGSLLRLFFEQATSDSTLLFNHRNKLPGSETRTIRFGILDDNDGVEFNHRTFDGESKTIFIPDDQSAVKPKKIERAGVTDERQATIHAYRIWNRMRYQHTTVEFDATAEASQLVLNERIEIADNTRPDVFDGHIVGQVGLVLELSQPFTPVVDVTYSIFIQLPTGGLDVIAVTLGADEFHVILQAPTSEALPLEPENWADVVYQIVGATDARSTAFMVSEKGAYDKRSVKMQAINYDDRYYQNDQDSSSLVALFTDEADVGLTDELGSDLTGG
jgi:hypothetical protein